MGGGNGGCGAFCHKMTSCKCLFYVYLALPLVIYSNHLTTPGTAMDILSYMTIGPVSWAISGVNLLVTYSASRPEWQMREAVYNQFNRQIWDSFSRDVVGFKFNYAMNWIDGAMRIGSVGVGRAIDHFGSDAFGTSDRIWRYDPLTGSNRFFNRNNWYFFALDEHAHGTISRAENNILIYWGTASPRMR